VKKRIVKIFKWFFVLGLIASVTLIIFMNFRINQQTKNSVFDSVEVIPENTVGLLLGTSKLLRSGDNPYFFNRIDAAVKLFKAGKIKIIVISGDNSKNPLGQSSAIPCLFYLSLCQTGGGLSLIYSLSSYFSIIYALCFVN